MSGKRSRDKGARGEREWRDKLIELGCVDAHRGCQHSGGPDSPDVKNGIPDTHAEVKRTERLNLGAAYQQALDEKGEGEVPYVAHRKNNGPWMVTMMAVDMIPFAKRLAAIKGQPIYPMDYQEDIL